MVESVQSKQYNQQYGQNNQKRYNQWCGQSNTIKAIQSGQTWG